MEIAMAGEKSMTLIYQSNGKIFHHSQGSPLARRHRQPASHLTHVLHSHMTFPTAQAMTTDLTLAVRYPTTRLQKSIRMNEHMK